MYVTVEQHTLIPPPPLWISKLLNCSLFSSLFSLIFFPLLKSALCSLVSRPWTCSFYHGIPLVCDIYPPTPFLLCFFMLLPFVVLILYSFILRSSRLTTSSLPCPCPVQSHVSLPCCTWYFYHTVGLGYDPPRLLIKYFISFHSLRSCECSMSGCHTGQNSFHHAPSLPSCTGQHSALRPATCNNPIGWHHATETPHRSHSSLHELHTGAFFFFLILEPLRWDRQLVPKRRPRNGRYSLRNNPDERSSQR